jgi:hypothetical protein
MTDTKHQAAQDLRPGSVPVDGKEEQRKASRIDHLPG